MKKISIIGLLLLVVGCSTFKTTAIDQAIFRNRTLSLVIHESPGFMAITSDKDMFTKAGFDAAYADGKRLVKKNGIGDPAANISKMTAKAISEKYGLVYNENLLVKSKFKKMKDLIPLANGRDYLLDVTTDGWSFTYDVKLLNYYVKYSAKARLIDVVNATTIGSGFCDYDTVSAGKPLVDYKTLVENDAAYIKQELDAAATFCVKKFESELL